MANLLVPFSADQPRLLLAANLLAPMVGSIIVQLNELADPDEKLRFLQVVLTSIEEGTALIVHRMEEGVPETDYAS